MRIFKKYYLIWISLADKRKEREKKNGVLGLGVQGRGGQQTKRHDMMATPPHESKWLN